MLLQVGGSEGGDDAAVGVALSRAVERGGRSDGETVGGSITLGHSIPGRTTPFASENTKAVLKTHLPPPSLDKKNTHKCDMHKAQDTASLKQDMSV